MIRFHSPTTLDEAGELIAIGGRVFAGGTVIMPQLPHPTDGMVLIDIARIGGLADVVRSEASVSCGAMLSVSRFGLLVASWPSALAVADAAGHLGNSHVRRLATVGGNLGWTDQYTDLAVPLVALGASAEVFSKGEGIEVVPVATLRPRLRRSAGLVTRVRIPVSPDRRSSYARLSWRRASARTVAAAAAVGRLADDGAWRDLCVVVGGIQPDPVEIEGINEQLDGSRLDSAAIARAAGWAAERAGVSREDALGADYRRRAVEVVVQRALGSLAAGW